MDSRKESGRPTLPTSETALGTTHSPHRTYRAANDQPAADVFVGRSMRAHRRFVELRLQDAHPSQCLRELARATDALASATWAIEYEAGLRDRGER